MKDAARESSKAVSGGDNNVQQCPHCGDRAVLETYESWTPNGGWKKMQRLNCLNTKPRDPELRCGKVTIVEETELSQQTQPPAMSTEPSQPRPQRAPRPQRSVSVPATLPGREVVTQVSAPPRPAVARPSLIPSVRPVPAPLPTDEVPRGQKYTMEQYSELISLIEGGMTCPAAAAKVGIQKNTAYGIIGQYRRRLRGLERGGRVVQAVAQAVTQEPVQVVVRPAEPAPVPVVRTAATAEQVVLAQLAAAGLSGHVRLLVSDDLSAFFRLPREIQEAIRAFFELPLDARRQISGLLPGPSWEAAG
ncbi:MAG: hypothetical protein ACYCW6_25040 [Candidatus Xenobia bacterium]